MSYLRSKKLRDIFFLYNDFCLTTNKKLSYKKHSSSGYIKAYYSHLQDPHYDLATLANFVQVSKFLRGLYGV
jgi:hypothetical protein